MGRGVQRSERGKVVRDDIELTVPLLVMSEPLLVQSSARLWVRWSVKLLVK